jgi:hypothetical protein
MLVFPVGAALLALWLYVRIPRLRPQGVLGFATAIVAGGIVIAATPELIQLVGRPLGAFAAVFLVVLPAFSYIFLVALWLLSRLSRLVRPS